MRFRVQEEKWHDQIPNAPDLQEEALAVERKPPYSIIVRSLSADLSSNHSTNQAMYQASMDESGLGVIGWW